MTILETPTGKIEFIMPEKIVVKSFSGFIKDQELKNIFNSGLETMKKNGGISWVSDNRQLAPYTKQDSEWISNEWFEQALASGWKIWAIIEPISALGKLSMKNFKFFESRGLIVKEFSEMEPAIDWVKEELKKTA